MKTLLLASVSLCCICLAAWGQEVQDAVDIKTNDNVATAQIRLSFSSGVATSSVYVERSRLKFDRIGSAGYFNLSGAATSTTAGDLWYTGGVFQYGNGATTKELVNLDATQTLTNKTIGSGGLSATWDGATIPVNRGGTGATSFTAGYVLFGNGTSAINSSSNLFWDNPNGFLGVGTATPGYALDVQGTNQKVRVGSYLFLNYDGSSSVPNIRGDSGLRLTQGNIGYPFTMYSMTDTPGGYGNAISIQTNSAASGAMDRITVTGKQDTATIALLNSDVGVGTGSPATRLDVTGKTLSTDADLSVGAARFTMSLTKNDVGSRTFSGVKVLPTLNTGAGNANTTLNVLEIDTANTATTGLIVNLLKLSYGGTERFKVDSGGNQTISGTVTYQYDASFNANVTFGNATSDTVTFTSQIASDFVPSANNTRDAGSSTNAWRTEYVGTSVSFGTTATRTTLTYTAPTANRTITLPDAGGTVALGTGTANYVAYWSGTNTVAAEQYLALSRGGTNAGLTASTGGIVYSGASALAVLAGTATAGQMLRSGASGAPSWSTATWPATATTAGQILRADGTNWVATTATYPATTTAYQLLYSSAANTVSGLGTAANGVLVTDGSGIPSIGTNLPTAVTIGSAYIYRVGGTDVAVADGGTNSSTALSGSSIMVSNGTSIVQGPAGTTTTVLHGNASGTPSYSAVSLTADVSGTLPVGNGGTGATSFTAGYILFGNGASAINTNANLFWDNTNNRLGIGTTGPNSPLHVYTAGSGTPTVYVFQNTVPGGDSYYTSTAVVAHNNLSAGSVCTGIDARALAGAGTTCQAIYAAATSGATTNYGIYATASGGSTNWAGYFSGDVRLTGTLSTDYGNIVIDNNDEYLRINQDSSYSSGIWFGTSPVTMGGGGMGIGSNGGTSTADIYLHGTYDGTNDLDLDGDNNRIDVKGAGGGLRLGANDWSDGGATYGHVVGDNSTYKALMIVGNDIAGNSGFGREVKVWDFLNVQGSGAIRCEDGYTEGGMRFGDVLIKTLQSQWWIWTDYGAIYTDSTASRIWLYNPNAGTIYYHAWVNGAEQNSSLASGGWKNFDPGAGGSLQLRFGKLNTANQYVDIDSIAQTSNNYFSTFYKIAY